MARWSSFNETLRKSPQKRFERKWQNAGSKLRLFLRRHQRYLSSKELVCCKRKRRMFCGSDFKSGVSPLIRDRLGLEKPTEFNKVSVFDRLGFKKRGIRHIGFKHGVSPLIRDRLEWSNFQKKQTFIKKSEFCKEGSYRRVRYSKENIFVEINKNRNLLKTDILNGSFKSGALPLNRNRLIVLESNRFNKESVFDRLGYKKRSNCAKIVLESNRFNKESVFDRLGYKKRSNCAKGIFRRSGSRSGVSPLMRNKLELPELEFQKKQPLRWKAKFNKGGNYRRGKLSIGNIFVKIDNNQDRRKINVDDGGDNDNQLQLQSDVHSICDDNNSNECEINNYNEIQPQTDVQFISDDVSNEEISSNECEIDNYNQPQLDMYNVCDVSRDASSNECVNNNLCIEILPDFVSKVSPAGSFAFDDGVRSFQSGKFSVKLYPPSKL